MTDFFIYLQCAACLLWFFLAILRRNKTLAQKMIVPIMLLAFATFFGDLCFSDGSTDSHTLVWLDAMSQFLSPSIAPLILIFVLARYRVKVSHWGWFAWLTVPLGLGLTSVILYGMIGMDASAEMMEHYVKNGLPLPKKFNNNALCNAHLFVETVLFYVLVLMQMLFVIGFLIWRLMKDRLTYRKLSLFLRGRIKLKTNTIIVLLLIPLLVCIVGRCVTGSEYYDTDIVKIVLPSLTAALITVICNIVFNVKGEWVRIELLGGDVNMLHAKEAVVKPKGEIETKKDVGLDVAFPHGAEPENAAGISMNQEEYSALLHRFNHELIIKKTFLDENITLNKLVEALGYNRTYLSYIVNKEYGKPFREVVGQLRIDYAMKYMKEHPDSLQETVALECGFTGAPAFNRKFTQIVGMTPRLWCQRTLRDAVPDNGKMPQQKT